MKTKTHFVPLCESGSGAKVGWLELAEGEFFGLQTRAAHGFGGFRAGDAFTASQLGQMGISPDLKVFLGSGWGHETGKSRKVRLPQHPRVPVWRKS